MGDLPQVNHASCACPEQFPDWHAQVLDLGGTQVYVTGMPTPLHMPIGYDITLAQQNNQLIEFGLREKWPGLCWLRTGWARGELMRIIESGESAAHQMRFLPKPFWVYAELHQGDMNSVSKTLQSMQKKLLQLNRLPKEWYLAYLTCETCAARKGGAKILVLRRYSDRRGKK